MTRVESRYVALCLADNSIAMSCTDLPGYAYEIAKSAGITSLLQDATHTKSNL